MKFLPGLLLFCTLGLAFGAEPLPTSLPGLKNFHRVSATLYRGAQPTTAGFAQLEAMGIKTVIDLRAFHSDATFVRDGKIVVERFHFKTWHAEDEDIVRFLKIVTDTNRAPFFVHCQHGSDRTGTMVAVYRMAVEGWSSDRALAEMTGPDFGFHPQWKNLVHHVKSLDVPALRTRAGLAAPSAILP